MYAGNFVAPLARHLDLIVLIKCVSIPFSGYFTCDALVSVLNPPFDKGDCRSPTPPLSIGKSTTCHVICTRFFWGGGGGVGGRSALSLCSVLLVVS
jgi:hypothetical protein